MSLETYTTILIGIFFVCTFIAIALILKNKKGSSLNFRED